LATYREVLERAAVVLGIELQYHDTWGQLHTASDAALASALRALGVPVETAESLEDSLARHERERWKRPLPRTVVVHEGADFLRLHVPAGRSGASVKFEFRWESGEVQHQWFFLPELPELERVAVEDGEFVAKRAPLPRGMPIGYHELRLYWMHAPELELFGEARFIVCPARVYSLNSRVAGLALNLYGLRSARNWGCGDFTDLLTVIDTFAPAGAAFLALNPLHAIANREPYNISPYLPECSLYRNFIYIDVEKAPGFEPDDVPAEELAALRASEFVDYENVARVKRTALRAAFHRLADAPALAGLNEFIAREGKPLRDFAVYSALWEEMHGRDPNLWLWTGWPEEFRDPDSPAVAAWAEQHDCDVRFYQFLQWIIDRQLAGAQAHARASGMQIGLYHDLALATDRFGADLWGSGKYYASGARVGAPPDALAPGGQDWGFPPPNREAHREDGYEHFARTIRNNARHGGALRIDHVMRFFRLFWIPEELTAADGVYVRDYVDDLMSVMALESVRGGFHVIGEDLGTVPPGVRERLDHMGILGYRLLWFEKHLDGSFRLPHEYSPNAAVSTTTHDLPTLAGFRLGRDIEARKAAGLVSEADYQSQWDARRQEIAKLDDALARAGFPGDEIGFILATPCTLAIVNQEDLTGETEQQNLPASTWQHPNWKRKMRVPVEELQPYAERFREEIARSGRA
jgi:4-alpha-glucanotransferase